MLCFLKCRVVERWVGPVRAGLRWPVPRQRMHNATPNPAVRCPITTLLPVHRKDPPVEKAPPFPARSPRPL